MDLAAIINEAIPLKEKNDLLRRATLFSQLSKLPEYDERKVKWIVENNIPLRSCAFKKAEDKLTREFLIEKIKELNTVSV